MPNDFISAQEFAQQLGISNRRVTIFCSENRIKGAFKLGTGKTCSWVLPKDTEDPRLASRGKAKKN